MSEDFSRKIEEIRSKIDLRAYVADDLGQPQARTNGVWMFKCRNPSHQDDTASMGIWSDHLHCFGCGLHGDVFTYVQIRTGKDFKSAVLFLNDEEDLPRFAPRKEDRNEEIVKTLLTMSDIERLHFDVARVMPYLRERKVSDAMVDINLIGGATYNKAYTDMDGKRFFFQCNRVALPYLFGPEVYSINYRRDDLSAMQNLTEVGSRAGIEDMFGFIRSDLARKAGKEPDQIKRETVMLHCFGTRFYRPHEYQAPVTAYGVHNLVHKQGGGLVYPRKPYVILTEGEFNQISGEMDGFTTVSLKPVKRVKLQRLTQNVRIVFIARDPDAAGQKYTEDIMAMLGNDTSHVRVIDFPREMNDMNEMKKQEVLKDFLMRPPFFLEPEYA